LVLRCLTQFDTSFTYCYRYSVHLAFHAAHLQASLEVKNALSGAL
jgi:hypothetical protein